MSISSSLQNRYSYASQELFWMLLGWLVINLLQAGFTELFHDEAYYWYLSTRLQMGYSEHAPGLMVLISLTHWIPGEIGVRLLLVLMNTVAVWLIYHMVAPRHPWQFFLLLFGVAGIHVVAFFAAPDAPLFFFSVLFWWAYRQYLQAERIRNVIFLALIIPLMLYSKYHGAMVLFFVVLSNVALLRRRSFWVIVGVSTMLYFPHLLWLWENDFGTFRFHLGERTPEAWSPLRSLEFILGFLALSGPLLVFFFLPGVVRRYEEDPWARSLKWAFWGIFAFLVLLTLKSRVEANWAATAMIPLLILGYRELEKRAYWLKRALWVAVPSMLILMVARVYLVWDFSDELRKIRPEFHGWSEWAQEVDSLADGRPVVFINWYQYPSKYAFYTGKEPLNTVNLWYHRTQISEWTAHAPLQGKPAMIMSAGYIPWTDTMQHRSNKEFYYMQLDSFRSYPEVSLITDDLVWSADTPEVINIVVELLQTGDTAITFDPQDDVRLAGHMFKGKQQVRSFYLKDPLSLTLQPGVPLRLNFPLSQRKGIEPGEYRFTLSLAVGNWIPTRNGPWETVVVVP